MEESFWKQRRRQLWLALGDSNSGYFHAVAKSRTAKNRFSIIEKSNGSPVFEEEEISKVIADFYSGLFQSCGFDGQQIIAEALDPCISEEQNEKLIALPQAEEIKSATFVIHADKAPGPDGFSPNFFPISFTPTGR